LPVYFSKSLGSIVMDASEPSRAGAAVAKEPAWSRNRADHQPDQQDRRADERQNEANLEPGPQATLCQRAALSLLDRGLPHLGLRERGAEPFVGIAGAAAVFLVEPGIDCHGDAPVTWPRIGASAAPPQPTIEPAGRTRRRPS